MPVFYLLQACSQQHIPQPRSLPLAVHDRAIHPVDALDLAEKGAHRMATIPGTLQRADDFMLRELGTELADRQRQGGCDLAVDMDSVRVGR